MIVCAIFLFDSIVNFVYRRLVESATGLRHGEMSADQRRRFAADRDRTRRHVRQTSGVQMRLGLPDVWCQFDRMLGRFHVVASHTYLHR